MRRALTCPACGTGAAALVQPLQGGQPRQELGARSRLGPGEVCASGARVSSPSRARGLRRYSHRRKPSLPPMGVGGAADSPQGRGLGGQAQAQVGGRRRDCGTGRNGFGTTQRPPLLLRRLLPAHWPPGTASHQAPARSFLPSQENLLDDTVSALMPAPHLLPRPSAPGG